MKMQEIRTQRADAAYGAYEFPEGVIIEGASGWEYTTPGREMSRQVYFVYDGEESECSWRAIFTVTFESNESAAVVEVGALTMDSGAEFGSMPSKFIRERVNAPMLTFLRRVQRPAA